MNKGRTKEMHEKQQVLAAFLKRAAIRGEEINTEEFVGGKKFLGYRSYTRKNGGNKKMEQKKTTGGFFSKVNAALGLSYELASLYSEAKKKEKETPDAVKTLTTGEKYRGKLEELKKKLGEFDATGFYTVRKTGVERYLNGIIAERGVLTLLDREAKRRYEKREKVQGRPLAPFALSFRDALKELPLNVKEEGGIYPTISHSMFLKIESALKKVGKFQAAMELATVVPEKWRKPFEVKEATTTVTHATSTPEATKTVETVLKPEVKIEAPVLETLMLASETAVPVPETPTTNIDDRLQLAMIRQLETPITPVIEVTEKTTPKRRSKK